MLCGMKPLLVLIVGLMVVGCVSTPTINSVTGIYEISGTETWKLLILKNGEWVQNQEGKPDVWKGHWGRVNGEIRLTVREPKVDYAKVTALKSILMVA